MLGREVHNEDVDGNEDASPANAAAGSDHEADGGVEEAVMVGGVEWK